MALTYTQLKTAMENYTENDSTEFRAVQDIIIKNVELRIYREADLNVFRKVATTSTLLGNRFLSKPTDHVIDRVFKITSGSNETDLIAKDVGFIQAFWPNSATTGVPRYYSDWDHDTFIMAPTPDAAYTVTLYYTYRPTSIVDAGDGTSWLGTNAQDVLLYGCLLESNAFDKTFENQGDVAYWQTQFDRAMSSLKREEEQRQRKEAYRFGELK